MRVIKYLSILDIWKIYPYIDILRCWCQIYYHYILIMYLYTPLTSISIADKYDVIQRKIYSFILCRLLCDHHHYQVRSVQPSYSCYYLLGSICIIWIRMIYVDKSFIVPQSKLAKENIFIHTHVTKDLDFFLFHSPFGNLNLSKWLAN